MASTAEAAIIVQLLSSMTPDTATGITGKQRGNVEQSDRFTQGIASGNVDRCYKRIRSGLKRPHDPQHGLIKDQTNHTL